jgi:hypothetical protein
MVLSRRRLLKVTQQRRSLPRLPTRKLRRSQPNAAVVAKVAVAVARKWPQHLLRGHSRLQLQSRLTRPTLNALSRKLLPLRRRLQSRLLRMSRLLLPLQRQ